MLIDRLGEEGLSLPENVACLYNKHSSNHLPSLYRWRLSTESTTLLLSAIQGAFLRCSHAKPSLSLFPTALISQAGEPQTNGPPL